MTNPIDVAAYKRDHAPEDAKEQALEFGNHFAAEVLDGEVYTAPNGETFTVYNVDALDDVQQRAYNKLQFDFQKCDKVPGIELPSRTVKDKDGNETTYPSQTLPGEGFVQPYQQDGVLVEPPFNEQFASTLLGAKFAAFQAAGGRSSAYVKAVMDVTEKVRKQAVTDSKSVDGADGVEAVSD